ncbi:hypothetical protein [uncultured Croceitalea sp.]|uniref:hypothetical protein n=1 Tax=uncultured Croceitalea sp. TaxID=1798908 RepID=UPI0033055E25
MSRFKIKLEYEYRIYTREASGFVDWNNFRAIINELGISLYLTYDLSKKEKTELFSSIVDNMNLQEKNIKSNLPVYYPHWNLIPASLQRKVVDLTEELHLGARQLNQLLRKNKKSIRLPNYQLRRVPPNQWPNWNIAYWSLMDDEKELFKDIIDSALPITKSRIKNGIFIPLPDSFRGRNVQFDQDDIENLQKIVGKTDFNQEPPFSTLFAYAVQNYENRSFSSFIITLTAALETGLKWYLSNKGDSISKYLLDNIPSPPLPKLLSVAISECGLEIPDIYKKWIGKLIEFRNHAVHKTGTIDFKIMQVTRWLAIGEAIISAIQDIKPYEFTGYKITIPEHHKTLPKGTKAIIMREEKDYGEINLHIALDSGVSARTKEGSFDIDENQKIE